jgi:hypothetical protein
MEYNKFKLKPVELVLGQKYMVSSHNSKTIRLCKFIKTTPKGHNFLAEDMDKCLFKKHIYTSKSSNHLNGTWFWLPDYIIVSEYIPEKIINVPDTAMSIGESTKNNLTYLQYKDHQIAKGEKYSWIDYKNIVLSKLKYDLIINESGSMNKIRVIPFVPEEDREIFL